MLASAEQWNFTGSVAVGGLCNARERLLADVQLAKDADGSEENLQIWLQRHPRQQRQLEPGPEGLEPSSAHRRKRSMECRRTVAMHVTRHSSVVSAASHLD